MFITNGSIKDTIPAPNMPIARKVAPPILWTMVPPNAEKIGPIACALNAKPMSVADHLNSGG